ncbi:MAG: VCBS repeat-containing protein [Planctomycetota bacterium]
MNPRHKKRCLALACLALLSGAAIAEEQAITTTIPLPENQKAEAAALGDVTGDGADDLLVAVGSAVQNFERALHLHACRAERACFPQEPTQVLDLTPDVVAFATGDVDGARGEEILLFTPSGVFACRLETSEEERPRKLLSGDLLWSLPHPRRLFHWAGGARDIDGDRLVDLVFPEPAGYRITFQRRGEEARGLFDRESYLRLPEGLAMDPASRSGQTTQRRERLKQLRQSLSFGSSDVEALSVWDVIPNPVFLDWNGDSLPDLLVQTSEELLVWLQAAGTGFSEMPDHREELPLLVDRTRQTDVSFGSLAADLNGDARADAVILAGNLQTPEAGAQVLVYVQGAGTERSDKTPEAPLFGSRGIPQQLLAVGGIAGSSSLTDIDGDGDPDLVIGSIKMDALDALRAASSGTVDARITVYSNSSGGFSPQPEIVFTVSLPADKVNKAGGQIDALFIGDVNGDGTSDLLVRDTPERIRVHAVTRTGEKLAVSDDPLFTTPVHRRATMRVHAASPGGRPQLVVIEDTQILHVRFPR